MAAEEKQIWRALKKVIDPEMGVNVVDLGLVYGVKVDGGKPFGDTQGKVEVEMTLTSPGCPLAPLIDQLVKSEVGAIGGVKEVVLNLVWDPPWTPAMISEEVRAELGID